MDIITIYRKYIRYQVLGHKIASENGPILAISVKESGTMH